MNIAYGCLKTKAFQFPAFYHLPPFFTLQPHQAVRQKQMELWRQLVAERPHRLSVQSQREVLQLPPAFYHRS